MDNLFVFKIGVIMNGYFLHAYSQMQKSINFF